MDVGSWLRSLGLGQYEAAFSDNSIDADVLPDLTDSDLTQLGVNLGDRKRLLKAIASLGAISPVTKPTRSPPLSLSTDGAERRPITVMFCDLVGSTSLAAKLDAEDWRNLVGSYLDEASAAVTGLGGHVLKKLGDGLMALFGYPQAQENDAERAVRAALAIQRALADLNARSARSGAPQLSARVGIECGSVVVDASGEVFGEAPNVAARVQAAAEPGSVLITASLQRQVAGLFVVEDKGTRDLKGVAAPVALYRVVRASGGGRRGGARALTPLVGREDELALLTRRWSRALEGEGQFVQIVGEPGIGKSRLIEEFRAKLADTPHSWVEWAASQLLQNTPLHPLAEWGRQRFGGTDATDEGRLADLENTLRLIGLDPEEYAPLIAPLVDIPLPQERSAKFAPEELRRRQLAAVTAWYFAGARTQPAVLVFEDLHWADPTSLDLMRSLLERGAQTPLLIVATTRPEFRPPWAMRSHHGVVSLAPLDRAQVRRMVGEIASRHALSDEMIDGVGERSGGVPLFVEEVTRLLLERDVRGGAQAIPPTLQQSLAARLDRLGEAREVAQIGAVLGRDFAYTLLRDVAEADEPALQASLDRLADADLLFVEGAPPEADYRFKHALIQDAAYDSLLKSRRQALHRRAAEALAEAKAQPEAIAYHFTQAGLDDPAIEWWGKAGDQALRRSAFQEAIAHLGKAIEMADRIGGVKEGQSVNNILMKHVSFANAMIGAHGHSASQTTAAFERAHEIAKLGGDSRTRFSIYYGRWGSALIRGELGPMQEIAAEFMRDTSELPISSEAGVAHRLVGVTKWFVGEFDEARSHLERALAIYDAGRDSDLAFQFGQDAGVAAMEFLALTLWPLGQVELASKVAIDMAARIRLTDYAATTYYGLLFLALYEMLCGRFKGIEPAARFASEHAEKYQMRSWRGLASSLLGWAEWRTNRRTESLMQIRHGLAHDQERGVVLWVPFVEAILASSEAEAGEIESALASAGRAITEAERIGQTWFAAETHRIHGDILLKADPGNVDPAEQAYLRAIATAQRQGARGFTLRASFSLAKLYQSTDRPAEAHAVLAPALEGFASTPEMPEIAEAQPLLASLAQTDEVKAQVAQRERLAQLQVAYGNALFSARGYGAAETTEAFTRARESASGRKDAPERLAADWGLWVGSFVRGDSPSMQAHSVDFLSDVRARPDSPEAGVAHRAAGLTHWFAGEYVEARGHLERALALFKPGRDDDLAFRFGLDPGVAAMASLAVALWPLGEIARAISLVESAQERSASITHIGTQAYAKMYAAMFQLMQDDHDGATQNAVEVARLADESDLKLSRAFGVFLQGWATSQSGAPADGIQDMRRSVEYLREQNVLYFDGLLKVALAEAEARAGDPNRAVAILDEALATSDRTGYRAFEAELHRARGEILQERDPSNAANAEEAFLTAVAVAKQQGTRSFGLRAALSLAKLYQSTGRPAEAHAVLGPALEGFSQTPEMREIQEAEALLAALAEMEEVKSAVAQSERRLHVQTAYGHAMMWAKGFAAEETTVAFSRAAVLAANVSNFSERFAAAHGQCTVALLRGELETARKLALAMLEEAKVAGRPMEARIARRSLALILYFRGDFLEARTLCEQWLDAGDPERELEVRERFGDDVGAVVLSCLAITSWQLGEVDRARELIEASKQRATEIEHATSMATPLYLNSILELLRGDAAAALRAAEAMEALGRDHGMILFRTEGELLGAAARGQMGNPATEAVKARQALTAYTDQGAKLSTRFFEALLAQLEAEASGSQNALNCVDEALAQADQAEYRWDLAFAHRLRGDILLKCNPSNAVAAEDAFKIAIAIAEGQGGRSLGLQAALPLAKLYCSTGRPSEAHAVLATALEGFAPTAEMPEIAEAQALLVAIEAGAHVRPE
jgi:class 3 adenylate cyclase/predicted ATPase